ncbi:MAG: hypothetical protein ACE5M4_08740 [Anaerolineales bacterium]
MGLSPTPIHRKVALIIHAPSVPSEGGKTLPKVFSWNDPNQLVEDFIADMRGVSYGIARFEVAERIEVNEFPIKADGFHYEPDQFAQLWRRRGGFHEPDLVDYSSLLRQFSIVEKVTSGDIDEAWLMAFPYAGYYESTMDGPGAFWCNSPPLRNTGHAQRRFMVMGFNYERGVGEMMEAFGHRAESIMIKVYEGRAADDNMWERFTRYDRQHPGASEVGNMHFAPNSERDYDWGNRRFVASACDDWYDFPDLTGERRSVNSDEWGGGDIRLHHAWWFRHLPHVEGDTRGVHNNWWEYILDPDRVR